MKTNIIALAIPILKFQVLNSGVRIPSKKEFSVYVEIVHKKVWDRVSQSQSGFTEAEVHSYVSHFFSALFSGFALSLQNENGNGSFPIHLKEWQYNDVTAMEIHRFLSESGEWGHKDRKVNYIKKQAKQIAESSHLNEDECLIYLNDL